MVYCGLQKIFYNGTLISVYLRCIWKIYLHYFRQSTSSVLSCGCTWQQHVCYLVEK